MSQKIQFNMLALQKTIQQSLKKQQAKATCLSFEQQDMNQYQHQYSKLLLLYSSQFGIYIMPQLDKLQIWHGVVFIRYGLYKDAKFKFDINFQSFPRKAPKVYFKSQVWHPLVHPQTGLLDLGNIQKQWNYGTQHLIFNVIQNIRLNFIDVKKYQIIDSYNKKAAEQYKNNIDEFFLKIRQTVQTSKNSVYQNYPNTSLKFMPFNQKHKTIRTELSKICEEQGVSFQDKKKKFMKFLKEQK